jgi:hypothetical protein
MFKCFITRLRGLIAAQNGSIAVMGVMALTSVLGMSGLAVEMGNGYASKVRNQRVADLAAIGAAVAYKNGGLTGQAATDAATQVAKDIANANGLTSTNSTVTVSPTTLNGVSALKVTVTTAVPIKIARMLSPNAATYDVTNTAYASLVATTTTTTTTGGGGCVTVLNSGSTAISATGGASITANGCAITTNGTIYSSNSSAKVTAGSITAAGINDTAAAYNQNAITATSNSITIKNNGASDFIGGNNTAIKDALCQVNLLTGSTDTFNASTNPYGYAGGNTSCTSYLVAVPTLTNTSTTDWSTNYNPKTGNGFNQYTNGSCNYTIPAGTYNIRDLTVGGGCTVTFLGGSTLSFRNLNASGSNINFGDGDVTISGTFTVNADNPMAMGNGTHSFGTLTINGGKKLSIGSGNLVVVNGISVSGGAYFKADIAAGQTVTLGKNSSTGDSITGGGSSQICFTSNCLAPTAAAGTFSATGNVNQPGSGSTIVFPNSVVHVINGDLTLTAAAIFGKGLYIIKGNWSNGTGCGACIMSGTEVTFALGGTFNFSGGSYFDLAAPSAGSSYGITDILIATKTSSATALGGGANGKASGTIYAPNTALSSSGGTSISSNGSQCLTLLVNSIAVSGSGTISIANCSSVTSGTTTTTNTSTGTLALIQ